MFPSNAFTIRYAGEHDADAVAVRRIAELDSSRPLRGRILVALENGVAVAAYSFEENRAVADPFHHTAVALILLRMRADALTAYDRTPSVRERISAAVRVPRRTPAPGV
jgi:hypothetical protein